MSTQTTHPGLAAVFRRAAEVIKINGHNKGDYYTLPAKGFGIELALAECPVCVAGALSIAINGDPRPVFSDVNDAAGFLAERLNPEYEGADPVFYLAQWNDAEERTTDDVVAELLAAAEAVEA